MIQKRKDPLERILIEGARMLDEKPFEQIDVTELARRLHMSRLTIYHAIGKKQKPPKFIAQQTIARFSTAVYENVRLALRSMAQIEPVHEMMVIVRAALATLEGFPIHGRVTLIRVLPEEYPYVFIDLGREIDRVMRDAATAEQISDDYQGLSCTDLSALVITMMFDAMRRSPRKRSLGQKLELEIESLIILKSFFREEARDVIQKSIDAMLLAH